MTFETNPETEQDGQFHAKGLANLLEALGAVPIGAANRLGWPTVPNGVVGTQLTPGPSSPEEVHAMLLSLGGEPTHPPIEPGSNVVSMFRGRS